MCDYVCGFVSFVDLTQPSRVCHQTLAKRGLETQWTQWSEMPNSVSVPSTPKLEAFQHGVRIVRCWNYDVLCPASGGQRLHLTLDLFGFRPRGSHTSQTIQFWHHLRISPTCCNCPNCLNLSEVDMRDLWNRFRAPLLLCVCANRST